MLFSQDTDPAPAAKSVRVRTVDSRALPSLNGSTLAATLVSVTYATGQSSPVHSHPCPIVGYVVSGTVRMQVQGEPEHIYHTGESFYEPPNGIHSVSANASQSRPATFLAFFVCDHPAPLSSPAAKPVEDVHHD
jgi:quercetin dioxygenase-like cupin family protein